jgi:hypothetical protein
MARGSRAATPGARLLLGPRLSRRRDGEGQGLAGAIDTKVGVPSPIGLGPTYPGLKGPVIALLRPHHLKAAVARWRLLRTKI